ncbi:ParB/RepB/Spo0J family partition protein [Oscillospiraceae bacterium OttesenSCG-928-G22]|nr:ParB/RepB/Spo0J family partition protein [Oscillospiraceae bacterium OttesenSCG-928-G22]
MMTNIQLIPVDRLDAHPDNPRKNLGDLSEIAASIKANGIFQNLTVVPLADEAATPWDEPRYRVVIGHRRLAAAKLAGLTEVPCAISDMTHPEQVRTMLVENMQRSELTVYEQAEGFQMMLDLGDSLEDIATHTGFSESTVRRRVKLLELDSEKFRESVDRGATLFDFAEMEKITDLDKRNAVLETAGTANFKYALKQALDAQETAENMALLAERLSAFATQIENTDDGNYSYVKYINASDDLDSITAPEDAGEVAYFFTADRSYARLYKEKSADACAEDDAAKAEREAAEANRIERCAKLKEISARAYELRFDFVKSVSKTTILKKLSAIMSVSVAERMNRYSRLDDDMFCDLLGIELADSDAEDYDAELDKARVFEAIAATPEKALLYAVYCDCDDSGSNTYYQHYHGLHSENDSLDRLYDLLETLGYKMSDEEKAMFDGTHELFPRKEVEPEEELDTAMEVEGADEQEQAA